MRPWILLSSCWSVGPAPWYLYSTTMFEPSLRLSNTPDATRLLAAMVLFGPALAMCCAKVADTKAKQLYEREELLLTAPNKRELYDARKRLRAMADRAGDVYALNAVRGAFLLLFLLLAFYVIPKTEREVSPGDSYVISVGVPAVLLLAGGDKLLV